MRGGERESAPLKRSTRARGVHGPQSGARPAREGGPGDAHSPRTRAAGPGCGGERALDLLFLFPPAHTLSALTRLSLSRPPFTPSEELVAKAAGRDLFHEDWLDAPWGTAASPVEVTSVFSERVVGVPDPADDSLVWWGTVREGEPPRQIIEGGEYFVLKKIGDGGGGHH